MPVRDEATRLERSVQAVLSQDYPGNLDLVLAVAPSSDATDAVARALAAADDRVRVVENPSGTASAGLNEAVLAAHGEVIARVDGHAELSDGYLRRAVELLEATGVDNVGGIQDAVGETAFERAVAAAMTSRFGAGDAKFHYGGASGPTDTVYLGVFRRSALERVGGFDESLDRNQDYELNWRIRESGGVVYFHPDLRVRYRPRSTLRALARQYFDYGRWKRAMLRRHPRSLRWRQMVPPATLLAIMVATALALWQSVWWLLVPGVYGLAVVLASIVVAPRVPAAARARLPAAFAAMHLAWGAGFLFGRVTSTTRRG